MENTDVDTYFSFLWFSKYLVFQSFKGKIKVEYNFYKKN